MFHSSISTYFNVSIRVKRRLPVHFTTAEPVMEYTKLNPRELLVEWQYSRHRDRISTLIDGTISWTALRQLLPEYDRASGQEEYFPNEALRVTTSAASVTESAPSHDLATAAPIRLDLGETATYLEAASRQLFDFFNTRTLTTSPVALNLIDPTVHGDFDDYPETHTSAELVNMLHSMATSHPSWRIEVVNTTAHVSEDATSGAAWMTLRVSGLPYDGFEGLARESICLMDWRRRDLGDGRGAVWLLVGQTVRRGLGCFSKYGDP
ncbi:hypothetical protein BAUCODRAFT_22635 [Baudoinia panamericana UAMH 10762]|uniref:SnoaL-like domain-containing protein n=1 Tax=Baudoinia panamericana (strain UAMH 10762) TaxID=717646 RepID=M2NJ35_BAUPA|nr:uncharacterized protein BAUCODRAFT_22635 [Baudoinia panamericana UAMH 10762]EMC99404.1 hypothetical protein BAUCODRAFT_22635 [Baudoinia panamericana UAMH 10762]